MKKVYKKPEIKKVELKPEEAVLACLKCPGVSGRNPGGCSKDYDKQS